MNYRILKKVDSQWLTIATEISNSEWKAAKYLANKMISGKFDESEGIVIAECKSKIVGFCSFVKKDIVDLNFSPYIATVYVAPTFRGELVSEKLVEIAERQL